MRLIHQDELQHYRRRSQAFDEVMAAGDERVAREEFAHALRYYRQAAVLDATRPEPHVALGVLAMQTDQDDQAVGHFQTAAAMAPHCAEAHAGLAMIHQKHQRFPQAFEMYLRCLETDGDNLMALLGLFQTSCQMGTFSKIIQYLEAYLEKHPEDHSVLFCLATLQAREGRLLQAKQALLTILAASPDQPDANHLLESVEDQLATNRCQEVA